jgi:hypothetical protein
VQASNNVLVTTYLWPWIYWGGRPDVSEHMCHISARQAKAWASLCAVADLKVRNRHHPPKPILRTIIPPNCRRNDAAHHAIGVPLRLFSRRIAIFDGLQVPEILDMGICCQTKIN